VKIMCYLFVLQSDSDATTSDADAIVLLSPLFSLGQCLYRVCNYVCVLCVCMCVVRVCVSMRA